MNTQVAIASPYPPQVGSRLVVALARALAGGTAFAPDRPLPREAARPGAGLDAAEEERRVALALRDTCRVVAGDLAQRRGPERPSPLAERLSATAGQIGEVLALFDSTTEEMHRLAVDALEAAPGTGPIEDGLTVVASEVRNLSLQTRRASRRVAQQVLSMRGGAAGPKPRAAASEVSWSQGAAPAPRRAPAPARAASESEGGFCLSSWLARDAGVGTAAAPAE